MLEEGLEPSSSTVPCLSVGSVHGTDSRVLSAPPCGCLPGHGSLVFPALHRHTSYRCPAAQSYLSPLAQLLWGLQLRTLWQLERHSLPLLILGVGLRQHSRVGSLPLATSFCTLSCDLVDEWLD